MRIISQDGMDDIPYADTWFTMRQVEDHYEIQAEAKDGEMYLVLDIKVETEAMEAEGLIKAQEKRERKRQKRLREA